MFSHAIKALLAIQRGGYASKGEVALTGVQLQDIEKILDAPIGNDSQDGPGAGGGPK